MSERLGAQLQSGGLGQSIHTGLFGGGLFAGASLDLNFAVTKNIGPLVTFTRASTATFIDSAGVLQTAATDVPRFDHNPTTGESLGLLVEEQRTNSIRNNTMVGAVAGTPGTLPTNWADGMSAGANGITRSVVGTGTENGIAYLDYRLSGTATAAFNVNLFADSQTSIAALSGQTWAQSVYVKLASGSLTGISSINNQLCENNVGGTFLVSTNVQFVPTGAALITQRSVITRTLNNASTAWVNALLQININSGVAIDITLRIGLPQLEQGAFATSVIPTTTAAATRSADVASITGTNFSSWYNQTQGTLYAKSAGITTRAFSGASFGIASLNDGTGNNENRLRYRTAGSTGAIVLVSNVLQFDSSPTGVLTAPGAASLAVAYAASNFGSAGNGGTPTQGSSGTVPTVSQLQIGADSGGYLNGTISRLSFWPSRLPNSTLQAITL